ncbi:MAG: DUF5320 domain-containing protein [Peptococcaceae bacterium]|nr:DUF5320 domain-containing protein [Peptococcaceae bacterium]
MPGGDGTGPFGMGPRAGRLAGFCARLGMPGHARGGRGLYYGRWPGFGRGSCFRISRWPGWYAAYCGPLNAQDPETEKEYLMNEARILRKQAAFIEKRLKELEEKEKVDEKSDE